MKIKKSNKLNGISEDGKTHGVSRFFTPKSKTDEYMEGLRGPGFTILENIFDKDVCELAKDKIDLLYEKQIKELGGEEYLISINDQNVVRALFIYDDFFLKFINNKHILLILEKCFNQKYILNQQNSPINKAHESHYDSAWHRDLSYQHFVSSRPIAINVLVCLDAFTEANGGTHVLPHSHKFEEFSSKNYHEKNKKIIISNIGDVLIFDSMLYHRAGPNRTDKDRKLLVHQYTLPFVKQQINFPKMLGGKYSDKEELSYLLGYDSETEDNVVNWRERKKRRYDSAVLKK